MFIYLLQTYNQIENYFIQSLPHKKSWQTIHNFNSSTKRVSNWFVVQMIHSAEHFSNKIKECYSKNLRFALIYDHRLELNIKKKKQLKSTLNTVLQLYSPFLMKRKIQFGCSAIGSINLIDLYVDGQQPSTIWPSINMQVLFPLKVKNRNKEK